MITFSKNCWRGQWNRDKFFFFSSFVVPQMNWYANIHTNGSQSVHKKWKQWYLLMSSVIDSFFIYNKDRDIGFYQDKDKTIWRSKISLPPQLTHRLI